MLDCRFSINFARLRGPHNSFARCWRHDGKTFIARFQQILPTWFAWVYVLDTYETADGYYCRITAAAKEDNKVLTKQLRSGSVKK